MVWGEQRGRRITKEKRERKENKKDKSTIYNTLKRCFYYVHVVHCTKLYTRILNETAVLFDKHLRS